MRANVWNGKRKLSVDTVPDPQILNQHDCIVKVSSTAICGSDLHLYNGFIPTLEKGDILGHEFMGEIVEVGRNVKNVKIGDRVVVPFPIACGACFACKEGKFSVCENSNPNAAIAEGLMGHSPAGVFGYSHMLGGFAGGQAEYVRVPFADVGPFKVPGHLTDEQVLFLSDILPTAYMGVEMCDIKPGQTVAVWGCGPVGQFAIACARMLGAGKIIGIDRFPYRLKTALEKAGATDIINYEIDPVLETLKELTGGRGPDAAIDCVGLEAHGHGIPFMYDKLKQATHIQFDRITALREAIMACANGGVVSIVGVYGGMVDKFPIGSVMNRGLTIKTGQCHVHKYMKPLLERIERGDIDPTFIVTHRLGLGEAPHAYDTFMHKEEECMKVVLKPGRN